MASSYVNNLRLNEMATGDASGTWGTITNTNLELIGEALGFGTEAITTNADTHTSTIADGASDGGSANDGARAMYLKYTGTLDSACTITIAPNDIRRLQFIENGTSGSQNIIISQGSGANVTITPGTTKAVYLDGAGSGAAVVDAFAHIAAVDLTVDDDLIVTDDASIGGDLAVTGAITSSSGATITTTDNTAQLTLVSTDADASSGPQMTLYRNSASPADADFLGRIKFLGRNDNSQDFVGVDLLGRIIDASDGTEDSEFRISTIRAGTETTDFKITASGVSSVPEIVFNEDSADIDFRVEGSSVTDVIFVNAGDNDLHIGTGADLITDTAGTSNVRIGAAAGDSITSGGDNNVVIGDNAGTALTTGDGNVAVGFEALATEDAHGNNTAVGYRALKDLNVGATGNNTAVGYNAGANITTGVQNTFIGGSSGDALTTASANTGLGFESLSALTTGNSNTAIGYRALKTDTLGDRNVAVGNEALSTQNFTSSTDSYNVGVGYQAGLSITTGNTNTLIGGSSGDALTSADRNVAVGYNALSTETLGERNVAMGYGSLANQNNTSSTSPYNVAVGYNAGNDITTGSSNTLIGGLAGDALTTGVDNTAIGLAALGSETGGNYNVAVGKSTLVAQNQNGTGYNTAVGYEAGNDVTTGEQNTLIGALAGDALTDADYNTAIGQQALTSDTKGNRSTAIGRGALASQNFTSSTDANNTAVGFGAGNVLTDGCLNGTFIGYQAGLNTTGNKNQFFGASAGSEVTSGGQNIILGRYNGNQNSLDIRTSSNTITLADGDGVPRMHFRSDGGVNLGNNADGIAQGTTFAVHARSSLNSVNSFDFRNMNTAFGNSVFVIGCVRDTTGGSYNQLQIAKHGVAVVMEVHDDGDLVNSNNSYGSLSDERLKSNIVDANSQWEDLKAIKIRNYKKFDTGDLVQIGVVAQELETAGMSGLVGTSNPSEHQIKHDASFGTLYEDGDDIPNGLPVGEVKEIKEKVKTVKYSVLYMKAIKALQEAMTRIETLEADVKALKGE